MAYDRYDSRRDSREQGRWRDDERSSRGWGDDRGGRDERGFFERAGDEIASWFGDDDAERRRRQDHPDRGQGWGRSDNRNEGHLRNEDDVRSYYSSRGQRGSGNDRDWNRDRPNAQRFHDQSDDRSEWFGGGQSWGRGRNPERDYGDRWNRGSGESGGFGSSFMSDDDFSRYERSPRWRDEGYRRPYTGRSASRDNFGGDDRGRRPMTGDYGRGGEFEGEMDRGGSYYGVGSHHDRHYGEWRQRQMQQLDRDYEDYARENRSRFEDDFSSWRDRRQQKRGLLGQIREHMEVIGSDGEHVGTVDRCAGDRIVLAKNDDESGGTHHSLMCTSIDKVEGDKVILDTTAEDAKRSWRDENRQRALFERDDQGEAGPGVLNRSFSGTY
jgi:hypothetical protein